MSLFTPAERLEPVLTWIDAHQDAAVGSLQRFCRQPSISAQNKGMRDMAELVAERLRELGAETSLVPTQGFPVVVGQLAGEHTRRLAIYDHYDFQPPEPLEAWSAPPFEATLRDGRLYARGVADKKGNLVARLWAVRAWRDLASSKAKRRSAVPAWVRLRVLIRTCCRPMAASGRPARAMSRARLPSPRG